MKKKRGSQTLRKEMCECKETLGNGTCEGWSMGYNFKLMAQYTCWRRNWILGPKMMVWQMDEGVGCILKRA